MVWNNDYREWYSAIVILFVVFLCLYIHFKKVQKRFAEGYTFISFILIVGLMHLSASLVTQFSVKEVVYEPRPYQKLLQDSGIIGKDFYDKGIQEYDILKKEKVKTKILQDSINENGNKQKISDVNQHILDSWI